MRIAPRLVILAALSLAFSGCSEDLPAPASEPASAPQKVAAAPVPVQSAPESADAPGQARASYSYDSAGRRDPFEPLLMIKKPMMRSDLPLTPLQTFDLGQLKLIGVIIGKGAPRAMVTAPDGKAYILQKGIMVGKNNGKVTAIQPEAVLVEEQYFDFTGEVRSSVQEIRLPKRQGVL